MYRANFYGQSAANRYLVRNLCPSELLFTMSGLRHDRFTGARDSFCAQTLTPFEEKLKINLDTMRAKTDQLKRQLSTVDTKTIDQKTRQEILTNYSLIERTRKLLTLMVEHMQKSAQNIAANFH